MKRKSREQKEARRLAKVARELERRGLQVLPPVAPGGHVLAVSVCLPGQAPVIEWGPLLAAEPLSRRDS